MSVSIHGLGYVGLTAAVHFSSKGIKVIAYDPSREVVEALENGTPKAGEFLGYLANSDMGNILPTDVFENTSLSDVHIFAVPTERAGMPDMEIVSNAVFDVVAMQENPMIIIESTLAPGTTDRIVERIAGSLNKICGEDYGLAVCPRRDWFADPTKNLETLPRVVGGYTEACSDRAIAVLREVSLYILRTTYKTAEITKALENALLHVPVMMVHQLASAMPELDIAEAVRLAGTHWRLPEYHLNFGTGGRCVPLGTEYLLTAAGSDATILREASFFEEDIRRIVCSAVRAHRPCAERVLVLGIAYRPGFADAGLSPGKDVAALLDSCGYRVSVCDPMWEPMALEKIARANVDTLENIGEYDVVLVATPHDEFLGAHAGVQRGALVLDAQGAWDIPEARADMASRGIDYHRVGSPGWKGPNEDLSDGL